MVFLMMFANEFLKIIKVEDLKATHLIKLMMLN